MRSALLVAAGTVMLAACAEDKPLNTFEPQGPFARRIDGLMWPWIWGLMGVIFLLVIGGTLIITIMNRVKPEDFDPDDLPYQRHGHFRLEITWTAVPGIILAIVAVPTLIAIWDLEQRNAPDELDVMVIGHQWWWEYRYDVNGNGFFRDADGDGELWGPDGIGGDNDDREWPLELALDPHDLTVANELVIPAGVQVDLLITSRDVIHSFWIPRLNGKRDSVPGRYTTWSLHADEPGKYTGWCTEFCGLSHARMRMSVIALSPEDFEAWKANQVLPAEVPEEGTEAALGRELFFTHCASCHVVRENTLEEFGVAAGDPYLNPFNMSQAEYEAAFSPDQRAELGATPNVVGWASSHPLTAKNAPDLTHFASRSVFAGAIFSQYVGIDANNDDLFDQISDYLTLSQEARFNEPQVARWIRDAPSQKDMYADDGRGMPAFPGLSGTDIDNLVAYLATLD